MTIRISSSLRASSASSARTRASAALAVAALVLAGCGSGGSAASNGSGGASAPTAATVAGLTFKRDPALAALLPEAIRRAGIIRVASNAPYPPFVQFESPASRTFVGGEVDMATALGGLLGVRFEFSQLPFDGLIPAVKAGRYDVVIGAISDNPDRQRQIDFVDYAKVGTGMLTAAGNPSGVRTKADLCGKSVSAQAATEQAQFIQSLNQTQCKADPIKPIIVPQQSDAELAVRSGRAQVLLANVTTVEAAAQAQPSAFTAVLDPAVPQGYIADPVAIGVPKNAAGLRTAIRQALQQLMDSGQLKEILRPWGLARFVLDRATINGS